MAAHVVAAGLTCPICQDLFTDPVIVSCCGHTFCRLCLDQALSHNDACPLCRAPLLGGIDCVLPNRAIQEVLSSTTSHISAEQEDHICIVVNDSHASSADATASCGLNNAGINACVSESTSQSQRSIKDNERSRGASSSRKERRTRTSPRGIQGTDEAANRCWQWPSAHAVMVGILLLCGARGRTGLESARKIRRWFSVNEPRVRCGFYITLAAAVMIFLRVQEEEFAVQVQQIRMRPLGR